MRRLYLRSRLFWWKKGAASKIRIRYHRFVLIHYHKISRKQIEMMEKGLEAGIREFIAEQGGIVNFTEILRAGRVERTEPR